MTGERTIAHLDMDAFYASVELRRRPELRGKPVIVCGSGPRAVVTTASYEARRLAGIHSAMPAATARRRLPDAVYIKPDFDAYREASREVMAILRANVEVVEVVGLDEAYLDLTGLYSPKATMRRVSTQILETTGLTCSVGISDSKLLAKITSELGKPAGLVVLRRAEALERFASESPGLIPGIGPKTRARLERQGLSTLADLRRADVKSLQATFGPRTGPWLHRRAQLLDDAPLTVSRESKSHSVERTFDTDVRDPQRLGEILDTLSADLAGRLQKRDLRGKTVAIKVRLDDWTTLTRARTVPVLTNDAMAITTVARDLLRENAPQRPVRLLGVRMASFDRPGPADAENPTPAGEGGVDEGDGEAEPQPSAGPTGDGGAGSRPQLGLDL